jgi:hypothetical protein
MASESAGELAESSTLLMILHSLFGCCFAPALAPFTCGTVFADPNKAFISQFRLDGAKEGPLAGTTLAVKDLFDVSS